ncbi:MAG TPA: hypothetical protein VF412_02135 [Bdellovibrio sp.]|uniref:hypothetical protein n=1 Tax=Bdellovibrio sp. TaxID=28201 RepID=UPI002F0EA407
MKEMPRDALKQKFQSTAKDSTRQEPKQRHTPEGPAEEYIHEYENPEDPTSAKWSLVFGEVAKEHPDFESSYYTIYED